jgi:hypothetical protein
MLVLFFGVGVGRFGLRLGGFRLYALGFKTPLAAGQATKDESTAWCFLLGVLAWRPAPAASGFLIS